jgi:hypothetical protein
MSALGHGGLAAGMAALALGASLAAQPAPASAPMTWLDLRGGASNARSGDAVAAQSALWQDRLSEGRQRWHRDDARPFPAFVLTQTFGGSPPAVVSILFNLYDCELPGNGAGADLYARCPLRVAIPGGRAPRVKQIDRVCMLYVPPVATPADGPDPRRNFTLATLGADRVLRLRTIQGGQAVHACDLDVALGAL